MVWKSWQILRPVFVSPPAHLPSGSKSVAVSHVICTAVRNAAESCGQDTLYISGLTMHPQGFIMHNVECTTLDDS